MLEEMICIICFLSPMFLYPGATVINVNFFIEMMCIMTIIRRYEGEATGIL